MTHNWPLNGEKRPKNWAKNWSLFIKFRVLEGFGGGLGMFWTDLEWFGVFWRGVVT